MAAAKKSGKLLIAKLFHTCFTHVSQSIFRFDCSLSCYGSGCSWTFLPFSSLIKESSLIIRPALTQVKAWGLPWKVFLRKRNRKEQCLLCHLRYVLQEHSHVIPYVLWIFMAFLCISLRPERIRRSPGMLAPQASFPQSIFLS